MCSVTLKCSYNLSQNTRQVLSSIRGNYALRKGKKIVFLSLEVIATIELVRNSHVVFLIWNTQFFSSSNVTFDYGVKFNVLISFCNVLGAIVLVQCSSFHSSTINFDEAKEMA